MKGNEDLQKSVQEAIKWEPLLNAAEIGVIAKDGIVTLTGTVDSYAKKLEAEHATRNVAGVKAVVEKIEIVLSNTSKNSDTDIAKEVLNSFKWNWEIPVDKVKVKVENGWVSLEGELEWNYQREAVKRAVNNIAGVKAVTNKIVIKSETRDEIEKKDIVGALGRNSSIDNEDITVKVVGNNVTLKGIVHSFYEKNEAERVAWNAPGVSMVNNELVIEYN
jgi:osmotically-inducible protein OsmY